MKTYELKCKFFKEKPTPVIWIRYVIHKYSIIID